MKKFKSGLRLDLGELLSREQQKAVKGGYTNYGYYSNGKIYCSLSECCRCSGIDPNPPACYAGANNTCYVDTSAPCFFGGC